MLKFSEHRSGQRGAEADAAQAWSKSACGRPSSFCESGR